MYIHIVYSTYSIYYIYSIYFIGRYINTIKHFSLTSFIIVFLCSTSTELNALNKNKVNPPVHVIFNVHGGKGRSQPLTILCDRAAGSV